jgi:hypothetical protein
MEMNFEKNILSQAQTFFTQDQFNQALNEAKAEIMAVAIQTTRQAIFIERQACAEMARDWNSNDCPREGLYEAILNRIPAQRQ